MAKYFGGADDFVLNINNDCFDAYDKHFKIHATEEKGVLAIMIRGVRGLLAKRSEKLKVGGTYRVCIFSHNGGAPNSVKAISLIVRVKVTGKNKATVIDDRKNAAYTQYLVHNVTIPKGKKYPDFIITEGKVARAALVRQVFGKHSPFYGPLDHVKKLEQEFDALIDQMGEIEL